ncbi:Aste57867_21012 [Aphanomyces stellatus]|uniref:Aste57867_21012 protein n=1 Tax=Aphanomyces stellatus TaxID=120398 RepID=A0A485LGJ6_9STRA|nr:hypothetical protein As57867_020944 [Aphanomyces stellatus]VFT97687.1 Aste57867_21012 [Aphanomyces stellatus]
MSTTSCPYRSLSGNVLVFTEDFCGKKKENLCVVTPNCTHLGYTDDFAYVGNISSYRFGVTLPPPKNGTLDFTYAQLPDSSVIIYIPGCGNNVNIPANFQWPPIITEVSYYSSAACTVTPVTSPSASRLNIAAEAIDLPTPPPSNVRMMRLVAGSNISHLDASGLHSLYIGRTEKKLNISHLKLSDKLVSLSIENIEISSWTMDSETFKAISKLKPRGDYPNASPPLFVDYPSGFYYPNPLTDTTTPGFLSILTTKQDCDRSGGQLQELFPKRKLLSVNYGSFSHSELPFRVCVVSPDSPSLSTSASAILGIVCGVLACVVGIFWYVRRARSKNVPPSDVEEPATSSAQAHKKAPKTP